MPKKPIYNAAHALDRAAWAHPDRPSITYGERVVTVAEAAHLTRQLAQLFAQVGVSAGDRVMVAAHNSPYHLLAHVACARLGAVFVPVSYRLTSFELQSLVDFVAPRAIICEPEIAARGALSSTGTLLQFVIDDDVQSGPLSDGLSHGYLGLSSAFSPFDGTFISDGGAESVEPFIVNGQQYPAGLAAILFTSGSVGSPKAVPLTHENLWWGSRNFRDGFEYRTDETVLVAAPLSHIGGFNGTALDLFSNGGHVVIARSFDAGTVLRLIEERRVSIMFGVPTMYAALLNHPDFAMRDLSSWRLPLIGGAPVPAPMLGMLAARGLRPITVWGMTETAASGAYLPFEQCAQFPGSLGRPFAHIEARVVEPGTLNEVEEGQPGELAVRGPSVVDSYWHGAEYTSESFLNGWLLTGDLVVVTPGGTLTVTGRLADRIMTGGEGVMPGEVEEVLRQYPGVKDAVVCGIPDDIWGERIAAALVMADDAVVPSLSDIQAFAATILARYKLPRSVHFIAEVPLNSANKVNRAAIREALWTQLHPPQD